MVNAFSIVATLALISVPGGPTIETGLQWRPPAGAVGGVVVTGEAAIDRLGQISGTTIVSADDLPRMPLVYTPTLVVALGRDALARLDESQLRALLEHVGLCGRVLLIDPPAEVERLIRQRAACGGRYLLATSADADAAPTLQALTSRSARLLPDEAALGRLLHNRGADIRLIGLYLGGFLLIFVTLTAVPRYRGVALGFSLLATALAGLLWAGGSRQAFVAWAEISATESVARYASLERASATGRGTEVLHLQSLARSPRHITGDGLVFNWTETARDRYVEWSAKLLQEMQVFSMGSFAVESRLRAGTDGATVTVCNRGDGQSSPAFMNWRGANYEVPALAPGAHWTADDSTTIAESSPHLQLLARRSSGRRVTLLQPLEVPGNGGTRGAWLMRTETGDTGTLPCRG